MAQQLGKEYFDGPRHLGLGGYHYDSKYFVSVVRDLFRYYSLNNNASILDIGCDKGFIMKDFKNTFIDASICGIDISNYCIENLLPEVASSFFQDLTTIFLSQMTVLI
jgi:cyclopropane fatty-acyl-phospholipid synthase-like methyltransferase